MTTSGISCSYVVTGGGRGVGRAVVERLIRDGGSVVAVELDPTSLGWLARHPTAVAIAGDASDETVAARAADRAESLAPLGGWVNNAAVFRDASLHTSPAREVIDLVAANLAPAVVGCAVAVRRFPAAGGNRQRLVPPGRASGSRLRALRPGQGGDRGADQGRSCRVRSPRDPGQRRGARLDRHRAVRGSAGRARAGRCCCGAGGDAPPAPDRPGREA